MRKTLVVVAAIAVALAIFGCQKKAEEPTAETAAPAMTVDEAKGTLKAVLEEVETLRATAEEPTAELVQGFKDNAAKLETLHAELQEIEVPEAEAAAYAEVTAKVEAGIEGVNGLAKLTEIAMDKETKVAAKEVATISDNAKAKFVEACEYAAPDIAAKMKPPAEEPTE
ncbi:MAG TPA: hypothetical protein VMW93_02765 [bacterium]|nr:hypothetical protein [bacterium]